MLLQLRALGLESKASDRVRNGPLSAQRLHKYPTPKRQARWAVLATPTFCMLLTFDCWQEFPITLAHLHVDPVRQLCQHHFLQQDVNIRCF